MKMINYNLLAATKIEQIIHLFYPNKQPLFDSLRSHQQWQIIANTVFSPYEYVAVTSENNHSYVQFLQEEPNLDQLLRIDRVFTNQPLPRQIYQLLFGKNTQEWRPDSGVGQYGFHGLKQTYDFCYEEDTW